MGTDFVFLKLTPPPPPPGGQETGMVGGRWMCVGGGTNTVIYYTGLVTSCSQNSQTTRISGEHLVHQTILLQPANHSVMQPADHSFSCTEPIILFSEAIILFSLQQANQSVPASVPASRSLFSVPAIQSIYYATIQPFCSR